MHGHEPSQEKDNHVTFQEKDKTMLPALNQEKDNHVTFQESRKR